MGRRQSRRSPETANSSPLRVRDHLNDDDTDGVGDVHVRDLVHNTTTLASRATDEEKGNDSSFAPSISGDGRYVAFTSVAANLTTTTQTLLPTSLFEM